MPTLQIRRDQHQIVTPESIKELRNIIGASAEQFAMIFGVTAHTVSAWEHGKYTPRGCVKTLLTTAMVAEFNPKTIALVDLRTVQVGRILYQTLQRCLEVIPTERVASNNKKQVVSGGRK